MMPEALVRKSILDWMVQAAEEFEVDVSEISVKPQPDAGDRVLYHLRITELEKFDKGFNPEVYLTVKADKLAEVITNE